MFLLFLFLFTAIPLTELFLLNWIWNQTSFMFTFGLVLISGILGAALARWQGLRTIFRIRSELSEQKVPTDALLDALLIFGAGLLLITPGVLTDVLGFSLLIPPLRLPFKHVIKSWFAKQAQNQAASFKTSFFSFNSGFPNPNEMHVDESNVIDAEVIHSEEADTKPTVEELEHLK